MDIRRKTTANSTYPKVAVQWFNEALCFVSSSVLADSLVLRNRQQKHTPKPLALTLKDRHNSTINQQK
ncbi:MAG: hypothetical protein K1X55_14125 [Chitinophagales bacterium]|nr:hypothetical protein [Chitinophagales bacterium]